MNWFDLSVMIAIVTTIVIGFAKGFVRTAVSFVAFVVAIVLGLWFYDAVGFWFSHLVKSKPLADAIGFLVVFVAVTGLGCLLEKMAWKFIKASHLTWLDRIMGGAFGVLHGFLIVTTVVLLLMAFGVNPFPRIVAQSRCLPMFADAAQMLAATAPDPVREGYSRARRDLEKVLPPDVQREFQKLRLKASN